MHCLLRNIALAVGLSMIGLAASEPIPSTVEQSQPPSGLWLPVNESQAQSLVHAVHLPLSNPSSLTVWVDDGVGSRVAVEIDGGKLIFSEGNPFYVQFQRLIENPAGDIAVSGTIGLAWTAIYEEATESYTREFTIIQLQAFCNDVTVYDLVVSPTVDALNAALAAYGEDYEVFQEQSVESIDISLPLAEESMVLYQEFIAWMEDYASAAMGGEPAESNPEYEQWLAGFLAYKELYPTGSDYPPPPDYEEWWEEYLAYMQTNPEGTDYPPPPMPSTYAGAALEDENCSFYQFLREVYDFPAVTGI